MAVFSLIKAPLTWILSILHTIIFVCILIGFHPFLVIARTVGGIDGIEQIHRLHNLAHLLNMRVLLTRFNIRGIDKIPSGRPIILVGNHQSMYDIPLYCWLLRKFQPRFIAKIELSASIPSISYSLRKGGHLVIKRESPLQAMRLIKEFSEGISKKNNAVAIFPEGTRAKDGVLKKFKHRGLETILKTMPEALVVPVVLDGSWYLVKNKFMPAPICTTLSFHVLDPIEPEGMSAAEVCSQSRELIEQGLFNIRGGSSDPSTTP